MNETDAGASPVERGVRPPLVLRAKTMKGKNRLRELALRVPTWNGKWIATAETRFVAFAPGISGPWLMVEPDGASKRDREAHSRWVHEAFDENFYVSAA